MAETEFNVDEYRASMDRLIADFKENKKRYLTPDDVAKHMMPGVDAFDDINRDVIIEAVAHLKFTAMKMQAALNRRLKQLENFAKHQQQEAETTAMRDAHRERVAADFGGQPTTAREAVAMYTDHNEVSVRYDGDCFMHDRKTKTSTIEDAILLCAEAHHYTLGNEKPMSNGGIKLAWREYLDAAREVRKQAVWNQIATTDRASAAKALAALRDLCGKLFVEPDFADAAIRKFIWQVKRRILGEYIEHLHMLIFRGLQGCGKTELARNMIKALGELACEAALPQILDDKNTMLRTMFIAFLDELARFDRADMNQVKGVVTGESSTTRVLYSHASQKSAVNLTLLGTADKPVANMINDVAGMRRFVEVIMWPKDDAGITNWQQEVVEFDWLALWQAVDPYTVDPLMSCFAEDLLAKQDAMRRRSNVEAWLEAFEFNPKRGGIIARQHEPDVYAEFGAQDLYRQSFRQYEQTYHPGGSATSLTTWGITFKEMIDQGVLPQWSYRKTGNGVFYRLELSNVVPIKKRRPKRAGLTPVPRHDMHQQPDDEEGQEVDDAPAAQQAEGAEAPAESSAIIRLPSPLE